jgi:hypothetical protein
LLSRYSRTHPFPLSPADDDHGDIAECINVTEVNPEANGGFIVFPFADVVIDGAYLINGVIIETVGDARYVLDNKKKWYKAELLPSGHEVVMTVPAVPWAYLHSSTEIYDKQTEHHRFCERVAQGREVVKNGIVDDESRHTKRILLSFPVGYELTINYTSIDQKEEGEILMEPFPIQTGYVSLDGKTITHTDVFIQWKLHKISDSPRKIAQPTDRCKDGTALISERFQGMNL